MSQAEALLASLAEVVPEHTHTVTDSDTYFVIDPITRTMENTAHRKNVIMQYDHESEVLTFEVPRYVEGHDMSLCNRVYSHWNNIDSKTKEETADVHELTDLRINPDKPDTVICSWLIKRQSTMHAGILSFLIQYKCVDDAGNDIYEWHTDIYDSMEVRKGRRNSEAAIVEYTDILEQWYARLFGTGEGVLADISAASEEAKEALKQESASQQSAIAAKGQETLASIPPDYTEMYRMAEEAMRTKADAIVVDAEGSVISVSNASDDPLQSLRIFGRTTQAGEPSPDNPQELESIENPEVKILNTNLLKHADGYSANQRGITCEYEGDGVYHIHGTYDSTNPSIQFVDLPLNILIDDPNTKYTLHGELLEGTPPDDFHPYLGLRTKQTSHMNWAAISIDNRMKVGDVISITRAPSEVTSTPTHINKFWIYAHNDTLESYTADFRFRVWLTKSDEPMPYTPYSEQTLPTQRTLNAIGDVKDELVYDYQTDTWQYVQRCFRETISLYYQTELNRYSGTLTHKANVAAAVDNGIPVFCPTLPFDPVCGSGSPIVNGIRVSAASPSYVIAYWNGEAIDTVDVLYPMAEPIIHDLTTEEVLAFKALRTNKPNTVIQNGVGAYMIAEYNADTEIFMRENQPGPTDEQINNAVTTYLDTNGVQVPSDDHIRALIDEALGEIVNGEY